MSKEASIPPELARLALGLKTLSKSFRALSIELPDLVERVSTELEKGYQLSFNDKIDITPISSDDVYQQGLQHLLLRDSYDSVQRTLPKVFAQQQDLQTRFANLPEAIAAKLPLKNGSPWRSFYLRECLDVLHGWPVEVESSVPCLSRMINTFDLIRAMSSKPCQNAFPLHERFRRFHLMLEDAVAEIASLRFEFANPISTDPDQANGKITDSADETITLPPEEENNKRHKAAPETLKVIRLIEKDHTNDEIYELIKKDKSMTTTKTVSAIRQIRSRWNRELYTL